VLSHPAFVAKGRIVAQDPELQAPDHARTRELLEKRHRERLEMWRVG